MISPRLQKKYTKVTMLTKREKQMYFLHCTQIQALKSQGQKPKIDQKWLSQKVTSTFKEGGQPNVSQKSWGEGGGNFWPDFKWCCVVKFKNDITGTRQFFPKLQKISQLQKCNIINRWHPVCGYLTLPQKENNLTLCECTHLPSHIDSRTRVSASSD